MADAVAAPSSTESARANYFVAQLVGPAKGEWLAELSAGGAEVVTALAGEALILRVLPANVAAIQSLPWVESLAAYRPAMKLSPKLRPDRRVTLGPAELAMSSAAAGEGEQLVAVTLFPGESVDALVAKIEAAGGTVMSRTENSVTAVAGREAIAQAADDVGVEAIQPFAFPELHNDVARTIMAVPAGGVFATGALQGAGQIVAICDSGLDTGVAATVHLDIRNRVVGIVSLPAALDASLAPLVNGPLVTDDGAADADSGHGTHVAGSVLGDGAVALAAGAATIPRGTAPLARLFFQASEQAVAWKPVSQLIAEGIAVPNIPGGWPPPARGLWGLPGSLLPLFNAAYAAGARVHTNSWGSNVAGQYTASSADVDQFMWEHRDMLIVFSAGNAGTDADNNGQINADSIGSPGTAKNCLTVGASESQRPIGSTPVPGINVTWPVFNAAKFSLMAGAGHVSDNPEGLACFSSRGPTDDGRIKPDVVAPGTNILSTRTSQIPAGDDPLWGDVTPSASPLRDVYCWSGGTSMSTPLVAGFAACVREHLVTQRGHFLDGVRPSGALVKAFLVSGAQAMAGQFSGEIPAGANNVNGFGRVHALNTITPGLLGRVAFDDDPANAVETGQIRTFAVEAANLGEPLKVTLCWTDRHSTTAGGLQNRLYLQIVTPAGAILNGDTTAFPTVTNNVQQVTVGAPVAGTYTIRVRGVSVIHQAPGAAAGMNPRQDFALAASNAIGLNVSAPPVIAGVVNGASFLAGPVCAGELVSIFGANLGPTLNMQFDGAGNLLTQLGPTRVLVNGLAAPLLFVSASQVNFVAPAAIAGPATVRVEVNGAQSGAVAVTAAPVAPGVFTLGGGQGAVVNQSGVVNGAGVPAPRGSAISIYATGGGATAPGMVPGRVAPASPLHLLTAGVQVQIGGAVAPVLFAGAAPGLVFGVVQINVTVPMAAAVGPAVPLQVFIGGVAAQAGVTIAVS